MAVDLFKYRLARLRLVWSHWGAFSEIEHLTATDQGTNFHENGASRLRKGSLCSPGNAPFLLVFVPKVLRHLDKVDHLIWVKWVQVVDAAMSGLGHSSYRCKTAKERESELLEVPNEKTSVSLKLIE